MKIFYASLQPLGVPLYGSNKLFFWFVLLVGLAFIRRPGWGDACRVDQVIAGSSAAQVGIMVGDRIIAADHVTINEHADLVGALNRAKDDVHLIVQRGNQTDEKIVAFGARAENGLRLGIGCSYEPSSKSSPGVRPHSFSIGGGRIFPGAELDTGFFGAGTQSIGTAGFIFGGRYFYETGPRIDAGLEVSHMRTGKNRFAINFFNTDLSLQSTVIMALARFHRARTKDLTPYSLIGLGVHFSELDWNATPVPGIIWYSGNPTEARPLVSGHRTGAVFAVGLGMEKDFTADLFCDIEGRIDILTKSTYEATDTGRAFGIASVEGGAVNGNIQLRLGRRFGAIEPSASPTAGSPTPAQTPGSLTSSYGEGAM